MKNLPKIAISIGDLNGIGVEIALKSHDTIKEICQPIYCINRQMLEQASMLLEVPIPNDFILYCTANFQKISRTIEQLKSNDIEVSLFIDPTLKSIELSNMLGASWVELHTGTQPNIVTGKQIGRAHV